jgi:galactose mutarotase-like enzyme
MSFRQTTVSGFPAVALRSAELEVVAVPSIGMKLTNLRRLTGREWLWRSDQIPLAPPRPGASYVETADSGGWDECFPTVGPCPIPGTPPGTPPLPDHGELWSAPWTSSVYDRAEGTTLTGFTRGSAFPYEFHRRITLDPHEPVARFHYLLRHTGDTPFPWIWSAHPLLNVQPGSVLTLPGVKQVKLAAVHELDPSLRSGQALAVNPSLHAGQALRENEIVSWPGAVGGETEGFTFPDTGGWALKAFGDLGPEGRMTLTDPLRGERLEFVVKREEVPQVGVWINCRGWAPPGRTPYYNLALEPCIGAPDRLDLAVLQWRTAQTLHPGEERTWSVEVGLMDDTD